jgi:hypothetical protein
MPYRQNANTYRADSGRVIDTRRPKYSAARGGTHRQAGHQFRLGPVTFWVAVGSLVIMGGWSLATGTYFAFHDDVMARLIARQADMQSAYEDRIAELRTQVDRITSRQLLDQEQIEQKIELMLRRQTTLESRSSILMGLPDLITTGAIKTAPLRGSQLEFAPGSQLGPSPRSDSTIFTAPQVREARAEARTPPAANPARVAANPATNVVVSRLARLQDALNRIEMRQAATLNAI